MSKYIELGTFIITLIAVFKGLKEYAANNKIKRADFLEKLILEFQDSKTAIARSLLDDFIYVSKSNRALPPAQQNEIAQSLTSLLRDHRKEPIITTDEIKVRDSFDHLLDFFTKLSYYLKQHLISPAELSYFRYYLDKIKNKPEVENYIKNYYYWDDFLLLFNSQKQTK